MKRINEGSILDEDDLEVLQELIKDNNQIIKKYDSGLFFNFVGYISVEYAGKEYEYFSYPKHYIFEEEKKIVKTISKSFRDIDNSNESFYISKFEALKNIIYYYNEYGLFRESEKIDIQKSNGKINFKKTIKKVEPVYINNAIVYDKFFVKKNEIRHNLITECMAYIIETGSRQFSFYFHQINTNHSYNESLFTNIKYLINKLLILKINTFKDEDKKLIDNIITYFNKGKLNSTVKSIICTTSYELIFEIMVHQTLNNIGSFNFEKKIYSVDENNNYKIEPDHLDIKNKIIADSKYYLEEVGLDYKQMFYLQDIANKHIHCDSYVLRIKEMNKWVNVLITPSSKYNYSQIIKRHTIDGLNLYTLSISINELIDNYIGNENNVPDQIYLAINKMRTLNNDN